MSKILNIPRSLEDDRNMLVRVYVQVEMKDVQLSCAHSPANYRVVSACSSIAFTINIGCWKAKRCSIMAGTVYSFQY